jgi:hypothetical protein
MTCILYQPNILRKRLVRHRAFLASHHKVNKHKTKQKAQQFSWKNNLKRFFFVSGHLLKRNTQPKHCMTRSGITHIPKHCITQKLIAHSPKITQTLCIHTSFTNKITFCKLPVIGHCQYAVHVFLASKTVVD